MGIKNLENIRVIFNESSPFLVPFSFCCPFLFFFFFGLLFVEFKKKKFIKQQKGDKLLKEKMPIVTFQT
jgi:hypothetical protein